MEARTWEQARVLAAAAAMVAAALHVAGGLFAWMQLGGRDGFQFELTTALRAVDPLAGLLLLFVALVLTAPPRSGELGALLPVARTAAGVFFVLAVVQVLNSVTLRGDQVEVVDRLQLAFERGVPAAVLAYAARRILADASGTDTVRRGGSGA
jgi:hypothetical protein